MSSDRAFLDAVSATPASYLKAARRVQAGDIPDLRELRVAVLSTVSAQLLQPYLIVEGARRGLRIHPWFAPFGQLEEQALDGSSGLYAGKPEVVLVLARLEELAPALCEQSHAGPEPSALMESVIDRLRALLRALRERSTAALGIANFSPPARPLAGLGDAMLPLSQATLVQQANAALAAACRDLPGAFVFDYARTVIEHGLAGWHDPRLFALARQPWTVEAQMATARALARTLRAALAPPAKCLVVDADNTLWGGVIGEDGLGGIALGDEYPGNAFKAFQKYLRTLKDRGVLLALVSKNEEADVLAVLNQHPDCVLRESDFSARRINWREKSLNVREIAEGLNLGLDALAFFDDNPFEREEVRRLLPAVTVLDTPSEPLEFIAAIEESGWFDQLAFSAEDQNRAVLYRQETVRTRAREAAASPEEFLAGLEMVATMGFVGPETLPRVAQLLAKTNQFNLTTRRHTAAELAQMIESGAVALWLRLADRFGDHGLVGVAIARPQDADWLIDTFLLSCRVIGRGAETTLLAQLSASVRARGASGQLVGEYIPSARNGLVGDFYPKHGFSPCGDNHWEKRLSSAVETPSYMTTRFHE
ncbi:MAG TPA: HAD-IIIC family phosphatase [Chthoniobacter sp.]|jgi:FkbH-like protein